jgi:hypothetical protein
MPGRRAYEPGAKSARSFAPAYVRFAATSERHVHPAHTPASDEWRESSQASDSRSHPA